MKITFFSQAPYIKPEYGYGDSSLIELDSGENILVDISSQKPSKAIIEQLKAKGIKQIDCFIASHLHRDHVGGFVDLIANFEVKRVITSGYAYKSIESDVTFIQALKNNGIKEEIVRMGDKFKIADAEFEVLFPPRDIEEVSPDLSYVEQEMNSNFYSTVFRLTYGKFSALYAADLYAQTEKEIVDIYNAKLKSTLLKIPHHGSATSTSDEFFECVAPKVAVILSRSCDWEIQKKFTNSSINVYGPFYDGNIVFETDGESLSATCDKGTKTWEL